MTVAVVQAAIRPGAVLPWEVSSVGICERLQWRYLPEDLDEVDVGALLRNLNLLDLYRNLRKPTSELGPEANAAVGRALQLEIEYERQTRN